MKLPIKPTIVEEKDNIIHISFVFPSWTIWSLIRWIFTKTVVYENYYECWYKLTNPGESQKRR